MTGAILKATNSSFQKGMTFCRSIYVKKVMKLLAFIFEQPSYHPYQAINTPIIKMLRPVLTCVLQSEAGIIYAILTDFKNATLG